MVIPTSREINKDEMNDIEETLKTLDFDNKLLLQRYRGGSEMREKYFDLLDNYVLYTPYKKPYNAQITVKLGSIYKPHHVLQHVCEAFDLPFAISVDFFFVTTSNTRYKPINDSPNSFKWCL